MQTFSLDLSEKKEQPWLLAKQGDIGRKFQAVITDAGQAFTIASDAVLSVWYCGTGGEGNYTSIGGSSAFSVDGNTVTVELITQMLSTKGGGTLCLVLNAADGTQIGMWDIPYQVEGIPGMDSEGATAYYTAFSETVQAAGEYADRAEKAASTFITDTTLSVSGRAADAKATGDALSAKAPAGYGLGSTAPAALADLNAFVGAGFYTTNTSTLNLPSAATWGYCHVIVFTRGSSEATQLLVRKENGLMMLRHTDDAGSTWVNEYINPPMTLGVEYRTTERYDSKPVYTKRIDLGTMPNASQKSVNTGVSGVTYIDLKVIYYSGTYTYPTVMFTSSGADCGARISGNSINVVAASDKSAFTAYATIKYVYN